MEDFQDQRMHCRKNRSKLRPIPKNLTRSKIYRLHQLTTSSIMHESISNLSFM